VSFLKTHNRVTGIPGSTPQQAYNEGKNTLVVGIRKTLDFENCKPSAHYQLPLVTSCIGKCEYCYLNTRLGKKTYIRVYVNLKQIHNRAAHYINKRIPSTTFFEASATSDPIPVEPYTGALSKTIQFFASQKYGRLRFVTKFTEVDSLLKLNHNKHTTIRFSLNTDKIIQKYEHNTPDLDKRIEAANKIMQAQYPVGFLIAPVILDANWKKDYDSLLKKLCRLLGRNKDKKIHFEIISHRFTKAAKRIILEIFPKTTLSMEETTRKFKYGRFGYGKYIYPGEKLNKMEYFFRTSIPKYFPNSIIDYII